MIEFLQLFFRSGTFQFSNLCYNMLGGTMGSGRKKEKNTAKMYPVRKRSLHEIDEDLVLSQLVKVVQKKRGQRGSIDYNTLKYIAQNSKVKINQINTQNTMSYYKEEVLASLNILSNEKIRLRDLVDLIIIYIEEDRYTNALNKLKELANETQGTDIYMNNGIEIKEDGVKKMVRFNKVAPKFDC